MPGEGTVSYWIDQLKAGNPEAARFVWERYFPRLEELARQRLRGVDRREADEEDLALSALSSFCHAAAAGRFPGLTDRNELWALLVGITRRKACDYWRRASRRKHAELDDQQLLDREPTPELTAAIADECRRLLQSLGEEKLQQVALLKMAGHTNEEIAAILECTSRTVARKLERIRRIWEKEAAP
jgi:RNA polymerase sigma factor (sigma-70 family)